MSISVILFYAFPTIITVIAFLVRLAKKKGDTVEHIITTLMLVNGLAAIAVFAVLAAVNALGWVGADTVEEGAMISLGIAISFMLAERFREFWEERAQRRGV